MKYHNNMNKGQCFILVLMIRSNDLCVNIGRLLNILNLLSNEKLI